MFNIFRKINQLPFLDNVFNKTEQYHQGSKSSKKVVRPGLKTIYDRLSYTAENNPYKTN